MPIDDKQVSSGVWDGNAKKWVLSRFGDGRLGEDGVSCRSLGFQSGLPHFAQPEFSVVRQHEEFIWLHDTYVENEEYAGLIVRRGRAGLGGRELGLGQKAVTAPWQCIPPLSRFPQPLPGQTLRLHGKSCRSWVRVTAPSPGKNSPR